MKRRKITSCIIGLILVVSIIASLVLMPYANFQPSYEFGALFNRILNKDNPEDVAFINSKTFSSQGTLFKTISAHGKKLKDVKSWNWYYEDVLTCTVMGMINGFDDGTFRANNNVTRAQFVQILYNYDKINYERDGIEFGPFTGTVYTDVPETAWYQQAAQYAAWLYLFQWRYPKNEYGEMIPGGEFGGNEKMTREELATVLWSYGSEFGSDKAREELKTLGSPEVNFEVHLPMLMNKQKVIDSIYKVSSPQMRSVYGNINGIDYIERDDVKVYDLETVPEDPDYLSTNEDTFRNGAVGEFIRNKFKKPSRFEK